MKVSHCEHIQDPMGQYTYLSHVNSTINRMSVSCCVHSSMAKKEVCHCTHIQDLIIQASLLKTLCGTGTIGTNITL